MLHLFALQLLLRPAPEPAPSSGGGTLSQEEIEKLLSGGSAASEPAPAPVIKVVEEPTTSLPNKLIDVINEIENKFDIEKIKEFKQQMN